MENIEKTILEKIEDMREEIIYFRAFSLLN